MQDLVPDVAIIPTKQNKVISKLLQESLDIDIVTSFVEKNSQHQYFISAVYISKGEILHTHRKIYLPTYGMFDEGRYFSAGDTIQAFDSPLGRIGILICEDFWHGWDFGFTAVKYQFYEPVHR